MGIRRIGTRNLHLIIVIVAGFAVIGQCLAAAIDFAAVRWLVISVCGAVAFAGVIWLGWQWMKLQREATGIAKLFKKERSFSIKPYSDNAAMNELVEAVSDYLQSNVNYVAELEKQVNDAQVKVQLLRKQKGSSDAIIYSIRDAVIVIDESDRVVIANEIAGELFGFDFKESHLKPFSSLIESKEREFIDFLSNSRSSKQPIRREIEFSCDDKTRIFDCLISPVLDDHKQVSGVVAVLHEITREKEISQMKNDFVDHVSHELKTPLASIAAYSEMLVDGEAADDKARDQFYSVIQSQAQRLERMIEDILNVSRIESGLVKMDKTVFSLSVLIEEQLEMIKGYAGENGINLSRAGSGGELIVFDQVYADKDLIAQVITNLLSNAIKYTQSGGTVTVETEVCNDNSGDVISVKVSDTGVGIPKEQLDHVFDKFYRVKANEHQAKGTGLGLNLVKQIVEKVHGGRIFVESEVGKGSTFGFELPMAKAEVAQASVGHEINRNLAEG